MPLRDDNGAKEDVWTRVEAEAPLADHSILDLEDFTAEGLDLTGIDPARLAFHCSNDVDLAALQPLLDKVALISVAFPGFADGRGFSIGRKLRAMGFSGTLRAAGPVIADQYQYLRACGFDEVETPESLSNRQPDAQWKAAAASVTVGYQRNYTGRQSILDARRAAR